MTKRFLLLIVSVITIVASAQTHEIQILSVNDMHAAIDRFPQFAVIVDSLRNIYPELLLVSAGDNRTGNPVNDTYPESSKPMVDLMNCVGFNYSTIGNHEFDGGIDGLRSVINSSNHRYLCANIIIPDSLRLHIEPFTFIERNNVRIGILGLVQVNPRTGFPDAHPQLFSNIRFLPINQSVKKYAWMRRECDVFLLLTHNGLSNDIQLAKLMPEVDVIIGGHSHTKLDSHQMVNNVMITQSERWLKYATLIKIKVKKGKVIDRQTELIDIIHYPQKDPTIQTMVDRFNDNQTLKRVLTQVVTDINQKEELGCLIADALRSELKADIAIQNSGGVRFNSKSKGDFTVKDVYRLDPFENKIIEINLNGEELERLLKAICLTDKYGPAYVSGIKYKIHLGKNREDIKNIFITLDDGSMIDPKKDYRIVMNSYIASVTQYKKRDDGRNLFVTSSSVLINYLEKQPFIDYQGKRCIEITQDIITKR